MTYGMRISKTQNSAYNQDKYLHSTEPDSNVKQSAFQTLGIGAVAAVSLVPVHNGDVGKEIKFHCMKAGFKNKLRKAATQNSLKQCLAGSPGR